MHQLKNNKSFSKPQLAIFVIAFALIGYLIFRSFAAPNPSLPGDLNGDNTVNVQDMSILLSNYNTANATADINSDGTVNVLDLSILLSHYGQSITTSTTIPPSTATHNIDGNLNESDWNISTQATKCVIGTCNNTATYGTLWDSSYIYVGVKVLDGSLKNDSANCWDDDSVEVYIDPTNAGGTTYTSGDRQIVQRYNDTGLCPGVGSNTGVLHAVTPITGGYSVELAIPWSLLGTTASSGKTIGFDIGVNDDDDGATRDSQLMYNGTASNSTDPSGFAKLSLTGTPTGGAPTGGGGGSGGGGGVGTLPKYNISIGSKLSNEDAAHQDLEFSNDKTLGAGMIRLGYWNPSYNAPAIQRALDAGFQVELIIGDTVTAPGPGVTSYASLATTAITTWKGKIHYFELMNEPDLNGWTADTYVPYLKAGYNAIKAVDPTAVVWHGGMWDKNSPTTFLIDWMAREYALGAKNYFDAFNFHCYGNNTQHGAWQIWDMVYGSGGAGFYDTTNVRSIMTTNGDGSKPTVCTEGGNTVNNVSTTEQATDVALSLKSVDGIGTSYRKTQSMFIYTTQDNDVQGFGLLDLNNNKRPAWTAFYNVAHGLPYP
jgi:hypothetical protein